MHLAAPSDSAALLARIDPWLQGLVPGSGFDSAFSGPFTNTPAGTVSIYGSERNQPWTSIVSMRLASATAASEDVEKPAALLVAWVGGHTLASASERDENIRMYNLDTEDNYVLQACERMEILPGHSAVVAAGVGGHIHWRPFQAWQSAPSM